MYLGQEMSADESLNSAVLHMRNE